MSSTDHLPTSHASHTYSERECPCIHITLHPVALRCTMQTSDSHCTHEPPTDMVGSCPMRNLVPPNGLSVTLNVSPWQVFGLCGGQSASPDTTGQSISHASAVIDCGCAPVSQT